MDPDLAVGEIRGAEASVTLWNGVTENTCTRNAKIAFRREHGVRSKCVLLIEGYGPMGEPCVSMLQIQASRENRIPARARSPHPTLLVDHT